MKEPLPLIYVHIIYLHIIIHYRCMYDTMIFLGLLGAFWQEEDWSWGSGVARRAHDGMIYFAGAPPQLPLGGERSGRAWRGQAAGTKPPKGHASAPKGSSDDEELSAPQARMAHRCPGRGLKPKWRRAGRDSLCAPGCCARGPWAVPCAYQATSNSLSSLCRVSGGQEAFLPVEHMLPRTEANTNAVRAAAAAAKGGLRVREIGGGRVSMLSPNEEAMRGKEPLTAIVFIKNMA